MRTEALVVGQGRVARARDKVEFLFRHRLPVTVGEVSHAEAPVAVLVRRTRTDAYRYHAGSYWFPVPGIGPHDPVTTDGFVDLVSGGGASSWRRNPFSKRGRRTGTVPTPLDVAWDVEDDGLRDAERLVDTACGDILFIGGVLHGRVREPAWRVTYTARGDAGARDGFGLPRWHAGLELDHEGREPEFWSAARFRIDATGEIEALLSNLPEQEGTRQVPSVEILGPHPRALLVEMGLPTGMPPLPGLASMPDEVLAAYAAAASRGVPQLADLRELVARLARVVIDGGPTSYVARCLVSDIAFPVILANLFPEAASRPGRTLPGG